MADFTPSDCALLHPCLYHALQLLAAEHQPQRYLEVGVREGDSLKVVAEAALDSLQKLVLCDDWGGGFGGSARGSHEHIAALLAGWGYSHEVQWLDGDSHQLLRSGIVGQNFDLILIDGDHSEEGARQDLLDCYETLAPGGFLLFDDIYHAPHLYLLGVMRTFLAQHPEFRMVSEMRDAVSGVAIIQRLKP